MGIYKTMELIGVSYNIMAPVAEPIRFCGQMDRMKRIPSVVLEQLDPIAYVDFMVVQESMVSSQHMALSDGMRQAGFVYETSQIVGSMSDLKIVQGGLVVFSRHPIQKQLNCVFEGSCAREDCLASKGSVYLQLNKHGQVFHIFALHVQAWESPESRVVRRGQIAQVAKFIKDQNIPANEPVVLMGDFNVDLYSEQCQLRALFKLLDCEPLDRHPESHPFSSDPGTNQLMGIDDGLAYSSDAYPGGCYEQYLKTMHCVCCPQELLDYALVSRAHLPVDNTASWMRVVPAKVKPFTMNVTLTIQREISDLSDHYPILARYFFPDLEPRSTMDERPYYELPLLLPSRRAGRRTNKAHTFLMFSLVGTLLVVGLFLFCWFTLRHRKNSPVIG